MKCKICNQEITLRAFAMHLRWNHNIKNNEYIEKHGEFRDKKLKEENNKNNSIISCKICNKKMMHNRQLMYHITTVHKEITKKDYIIKFNYNGVNPKCKCGCGSDVEIVFWKDQNKENFHYHNDYIKGHWDWIKPGYHSHSEETKIQMRKSAINRIEKEKGLFKGISKLEKELVKFIKNNYNKEIQLNNNIILSGQEIDIYLPDIKLAIEFNGIYYHSDLFKNKQYHLKKTKECNKQGITLIHIWDYDWIKNNDIIKSIILNKLNKTQYKIYARKCEIREVNNKDSVIFLTKNHLQKSALSNKRLGLYYNNELVSIMTFSKLRKI